MKSILKFLTALSLITSFAYADDNFTIRDGDGNKRTIAATDNGLEVYTIQVEIGDGGSGLSQSVVPVSNNTDLNGVGAMMVGALPVTDDTIEAASTTTLINATGHVARVGDIFATISGTAANLNSWSSICAPVTANSFTLCNALPTTPSTDNFRIFRPKIPSITGTSSNPGLAVTIQTSSQDAASIGLLKTEDAASASGDAGVMSLSVQNDGWATLAATGDYIAQAAGRAGNQYTTLVIDDVLAGSHSPIRNEDAAFANLDPVVMAGGVRNEGGTTFNDANLDVNPIATTRTGSVYSTLSTLVGGDANSGKQPYRDEDTAFAASDAVMIGGGQALSTVAQSVGTTGDVAPIAMDLGNRQIVTFAPAGELVFGCNTAITTATTGTIISANASKNTYLSEVNCTNTGAAATRVEIQQTGGTVLANVMLPATTGFATISFPVPIITSTANKAIIANVITTGSSTICCASGYYGAI